MMKAHWKVWLFGSLPENQSKIFYTDKNSFNEIYNQTHWSTIEYPLNSAINQLFTFNSTIEIVFSW